MIRGHIIELKPNNKQATYFAKACGVARFAYNWALAQWQQQYEFDELYKQECQYQGVLLDTSKLNKPSQFALRRQLNSIKKENFAWMLDVSKCAPQMAIIQLGKAFDNFFKKLKQHKLAKSKKAKNKNPFAYPKPRRKGKDDRFTLSNDQFKLKQHNNKSYIQIPKLGLVKMTESLRFEGKLVSATVFCKANRWFVSIAVELSGNDIAKTIKPNQSKTGKAVGVDLGVSNLAALSDGTKIQAPKPLKSKLKQLRRLNKSLARKQKGSSNRAKAKTKLSRLHLKILNIRKDFLHKLTTKLVQAYDVICVENLNTKGMVKNHRLSRAISDLGFYELKRQLIYKANQLGKQVKEVDRFYPSSKTCSVCQYKLDKLPLSVRSWICPNCQTQHDRDINAAINILNHADTILSG